MFMVDDVEKIKEALETEEDSSVKTVKNNAGTTILQGPLSDDGTTFTKGKLTDP